MDLPSNLYHDSNCMGLVLYASFSIHGDPNFILSHLNSGKSHSLYCQCQMSMTNVDDQTIAFSTSKEEITWLLELGEFIWISYVPGEPFKNMLQHCNHIKASFVSDWPGVIVQKCALQLLYHQEDDKNHNKCKSEAQQQIYSSKLPQTLSQVHVSPPPLSATATATQRDRAVREAVDRVLAMATKGKRRWSYAFLTNWRRRKFQKKHRKQQRVVSATGTSRSPKKHKVSVLRLKGKSLLAVKSKMRVLSRVVPGCRKLSLPVILEEATDYIAALEMQVRAMTTLANLLSGSSSSSASSSSAPPPS
ncbi:transcription factor bHLH148-like [Quercus suber]